jgi:thymidylate kinase
MLILLEGIDGSGKTTLAKNLTNLLENAVYHFEPSKHNEVNSTLREFCLQEKYKGQVTTYGRELMLLASRANSNAYLAELMHTYDNVVQDRGFVSGMTYANIATIGSLDPLDWLDVAQLMGCIIEPDLIVLVEPTTQRISKVAGDIYDNADVEFHSKVSSSLKENAFLAARTIAGRCIVFENDMGLTPLENAMRLKSIIEEVCSGGE